MGVKNPKVDAYLGRVQPFARPILTKLRSLFHRASPLLEEKIKWGVPTFEHKGIVGIMAGFKQHVRWGLWKAKAISGAQGMGENKITDISELPPDKVIIKQIKEAVALNEKSIKAPRPKPRPAPRTPADLAAALKKNAKAAATFKKLSPSHKREYIEWITDSKREETRKRRLAQAVQWMSQGKPHNWKYV